MGNYVNKYQLDFEIKKFLNLSLAWNETPKQA